MQSQQGRPLTLYLSARLMEQLRRKLIVQYRQGMTDSEAVALAIEKFLNHDAKKR